MVKTTKFVLFVANNYSFVEMTCCWKELFLEQFTAKMFFIFSRHGKWNENGLPLRPLILLVNIPSKPESVLDSGWKWGGNLLRRYIPLFICNWPGWVWKNGKGPRGNRAGLPDVGHHSGLGNRDHLQFALFARFGKRAEIHLLPGAHVSTHPATDLRPGPLRHQSAVERSWYIVVV